MEHRFSGRAVVNYLDATRDDVRRERNETVDLIRQRGLRYPVTLIDGEPLYEGSVSYPAILRAVTSRLSSDC